MSQAVLYYVQDATPFEVVGACTFDISQAYLAIHCTVDAKWERVGKVGCFPYSADNGVVSNITAREVLGRKRF